MAKSYEGLKADAQVIKNEIEASRNTATRVGTMLVDIVDKVNEDFEEVRQGMDNFVAEYDQTLAKIETTLGTIENVTIHSGGVINITSNATTTIAQKMSKMADGDIVIFVIGDSRGSYPSTESRVNVDAGLSISTNYFFSTERRGANVGDLLFVVKKTITLIQRIVCRIIPLNDAKPDSDGYIGTEGIVTVNDKKQINKIADIETTANKALPKSDQLPSRWASNMNEALQTGLYPWCTLGRPTGSTGAYTCLVQRTSTNDGAYDTVEQTAYGREAELGRVFKRIIFIKTDGTDNQYGEWIEISNSSIDVTALFTEGGTLNVSTNVLRSSHLHYNDSSKFFSTVTLSVSNRVWYMDARATVVVDDVMIDRLYRAVVKPVDGIFRCSKVIYKEFKI